MSLNGSSMDRLLVLVLLCFFGISGAGCTKKKPSKKEKKGDQNADATNACDPSTNPLCNSKLQPIQPTSPGNATLLPFESDAAYREYVADLAKTAGENWEKSGYGAQPASASSEMNTSITNNQENDVDEGDIVKNIGDYMIVLRKGKLYVINIKLPGTPKQADSMVVAPSPHLTENVWYDEMLVLENTVVVLGFRYVIPGGTKLPGPLSEEQPLTAGATEIHAFSLVNGKLTRGKSAYLESTDYFSSSNFSSRLIGKSVYFYLPERAFSYTNGSTVEPNIPRQLLFTDSATGGAFSFGNPLLTFKEIHRSPLKPSNPALHLVVKCSMESAGSPDCTAGGVLGDAVQHVYTSKDYVYLWSYPQLFSLPLATLSPKTFTVKGLGEPVSHLGFKQTDANLTIILKDIRSSKGSVLDQPDSSEFFDEGSQVGTPGTSGEASPEKNEAVQYEHVINAVTLPLKDFDGNGNQTIPEQNITKIYSSPNIVQAGTPRAINQTFLIPVNVLEPESGTFFSGLSLASRGGNGQNFILSFDIMSHASKVSEWGGLITRIEGVGSENAVVIDSSESTAGSSQQKGLRIASIKATGNLVPISQVILPGASEGESRTHGFFYKNKSGPTPGTAQTGDGLFGLSIVNTSSNSTHWFGSGISNLTFVSTTSAGLLSSIGTISSEGTFQNTCKSSCIDWYGNTRPIFLGDRIFALQGGEFAEIAVTSGKTQRMGASILMQ